MANVYVEKRQPRVKANDRILRSITVLTPVTQSPFPGLTPNHDAGGILLLKDLGLTGKYEEIEAHVVADENVAANATVELADQDYTATGDIHTLKGTLIETGTVLKKGTFLFVSHDDGANARGVFILARGFYQAPTS